MSGLNSEDLIKKFENLENRFKLLEQSLEQGNHPWGVVNARKVTGFQQGLKTIQANISKFQLVDVYNIAPQILASIAIKVSLTADSYRQNNFGEVYFEKTGNGNYWIVNTTENIYFLVPKDTIKINIPVMKTVELLFDCQGYQEFQSREFSLDKPALVSLTANNQQWKLEELGVIDFNELSPTSQVQLELKKARVERKQIQHQLRELSRNFDEIKDYLQKFTQINQDQCQSPEIQLEEFKSTIKQVVEEQKKIIDSLKIAEKERNKIRLQIKQENVTQIDKDSTSASFNWHNAKILHTLTGHTHMIRCLTVWNWQQNDNQSNKKIIASGSYDKTIKIWNLLTGELISTLTGTSMINAIAISSDGYTLVSNGNDNTIKVWNLNTASHKVFSGHSNMVLSLAISPDGKTLLSGSRDHTLKLWDLNTGEITHSFDENCGNTITALDISSDEKVMVSSSSDHTIRVWDFNTERQSRVSFNRVLLTHSNLIWSIALSPDSQVLVAGSRDSTIRLWDVATGELIKTLEGHSDAVWSIAISPNGQVLASGSADRTIKLWNFDTGELLCTLSEHTQEVYTVSFSPDGKYLVSGGRDQKVIVWQSEN